MAQLLILGHKTRSKEVIEILEMLGGRNSREYVCNVPGYAYSIDEQGIIDLYISHSNSSITFTLEEFLEKFPYKVGDKVNSPCKGCVKTITSMEWDTHLNTVTYKLDNRIYTNIDQLKVVNDLQPYEKETVEKINVAKLLKDCPQGMELNCTVYDECILDSILEGELHPIKIQTPEGKMLLTKYGSFSCNKHSKCIIFPKDKTTWEGFVPPCKFKDGDVVAHQNHMGTWIGIYHKHDYLNETFSSYCCIGRDGKFWADFNNDHGYDKTRLATEEEKAKLFQAIKDNGYKWNAETKTLEKLVEPKFKVGDKVRHKNNHGVVFTITSIEEDFYACGVATAFWFDDQDDYELVPDKFDITTLKPFDEVLVRNTNNGRWRGQFYMSYDKNEEYPFECAYNCWKQCIPYENNEHLFDKTDDCTDYFKTWE